MRSEKRAMERSKRRRVDVLCSVIAEASVRFEGPGMADEEATGDVGEEEEEEEEEEGEGGGVREGLKSLVATVT